MSLDSPALSPAPFSAGPAAACPSPSRFLTTADLLNRVVSARDLDKHPSPPPPWLWQGYLGPGKVTLLTSQWKSGKTTLVSLLLARMQQGGQLAGLPVAAGKAFVVTEESKDDWRPRLQRLGIRDRVDFLYRPFLAQPSMAEWLALIETAAVLRQGQGIDLLVIDSLSKFLPAHSENSAGALLECLTPLQRLSTAGMSVLLPHHPRKGKTVPGQAARGSGALPSFVDMIIEMGYYSQPDDLDRRRRLLGFSRHEETPRHLLIELQADGMDYLVLQSGLEAALGDSLTAVLHVLSDASTKLTRQEILDRWSADYSKPDSSTLWRWLSRALAQGLVRQEGTGRAGDPFRYWLPEREALMRPDGGTAEEMQAWNERWVGELLGRIKPSDATPPPEETPPSSAGGILHDRTEGAGAAEPFEDSPLSADEDAPAAPAAPAAAEPEPVTTPLEPAHLPYPYNTMNPEDVPEEVWRRARVVRAGD
jgi:hypothetical protein